MQCEESNYTNVEIKFNSHTILNTLYNKYIKFFFFLDRNELTQKCSSLFPRFYVLLTSRHNHVTQY